MSGIKFEVTTEKQLFREARIIIYSNHSTEGGILSNMFSTRQGTPMLNVAEALVLIDHLESFVNSNCRRK